MSGNHDGPDRRPCEWCGTALGPSPRTRRYHPGACATAARRARQRTNQATYRQRQRGPEHLVVPPDLRVGRVTVRSIVLPGEDTAALRAVALPVMRSAIEFHQALTEVPYTDVLDKPQLLRLRAFVDETLTLIEALNDTLPMGEVDSDIYDPGDGLEIVKRLWLNSVRSGKRASRR